MTDAALSEFEALEIDPLIAPRPAEPRDSSRLIIVDRVAQSVGQRVFSDLPGLMTPGDVLVLNRSKEWKARLPARKSTGGRSELLLTGPEGPALTVWNALVRKSRPGQKLICRGGAEAVAVKRNPDGSFLFELSVPLDEAYLERNAEVPLPQYILKARRREPKSPSFPLSKRGMKGDFLEDDSSYQTVFADAPGSIAAPTAGFHFTPELLEKIKAKGVDVRYITLHIGWGTFKPVRNEDPAAHLMLEEAASVPDETASALNAAKEKGARIIAVGTSSMRTLETFSGENGRLRPGERKAGLFIQPGYKFRPRALTNLRVPSSAALHDCRFRRPGAF